MNDSSDGNGVNTNTMEGQPSAGASPEAGAEKETVGGQHVEIGTFEITSGTAVISDPADCIDSGCQRVLRGVRRGVWSAHVVMDTDDGTRIARLVACASDEEHASGAAPWEHPDLWMSIDLDSGLCGVFDKKGYRDVANGTAGKSAGWRARRRIGEDDVWFDGCCDVVLHAPHGAGVIPCGCVASCGYDGGIYRCDYKRDDEGCIFCIKVVLISRRDDDEAE